MELIQVKLCLQWSHTNPCASKLFEDSEASVRINPSAWRFGVGAAASSVKVATVVVQPVRSVAVRVFETHNIIKLHWGPINSVPGEDLESEVVVVEPAVSWHPAGCSVNNSKGSVNGYGLKVKRAKNERISWLKFLPVLIIIIIKNRLNCDKKKEKKLKALLLVIKP